MKSARAFVGILGATLIALAGCASSGGETSTVGSSPSSTGSGKARGNSEYSEKFCALAREVVEVRDTYNELAAGDSDDPEYNSMTAPELEEAAAAKLNEGGKLWQEIADNAPSELKDMYADISEFENALMDFYAEVIENNGSYDGVDTDHFDKWTESRLDEFSQTLADADLVCDTDLVSFIENSGS